MAENKIIPWAQTGTANVLSDDAYASDVAKGGLYGDGVKTGQASSQQANKTWRQATVPGSGLGQFLVDNLSVDVTDADTPSTFSARIANAVLKLAQISPFNQSWAVATGGYRKYAIVSDSLGNYWSSASDQNVTVPSADGAKWRSLFDGYATQSWSNTAFVKNLNGMDGGIVSAAMDASGVPSFQSGTGKWYPVQLKGDYATNPALQAETQRATNIESNLQSSKFDKAGGVISGSASVTGNMTVSGSAGIIANCDPGGQTIGQFMNYAGIYSVAGGRGGKFGFYLQEHVGTGFNGVITAIYPNGQGYRALGMPQGQKLSDSLFGELAYASDLQRYITTDTYSSDFATADSRVINLPYGHRIQVFQAYVGDGTTTGSWITFPQAFSGTPVFYQANSNGNGDGSTDTDYWCYGANSTGMYVRPRNHQGSANIIVIGPK